MSANDASTPFSESALLRCSVVWLVRARLLAGESRLRVVHDVANMKHVMHGGVLGRVSRRSIYRWLAIFEAEGMAGLENRPRKPGAASRVLSGELLAFLAQARGADPGASIPELLRRAKAHGLLALDKSVDRSTVYRALGRMQVPVGRTKQERLRDMRRFAYSHRMEMVLADGKHFRAGIARARRVALFFLDDATRRGLHVVVGTSEKAELFLRGLYECLCAHGRMGILYLDQGPGFLAKAVAQVCRRLEIALVYGERRYPQGHGKIERLNQTAWHAVLRSLDGRCEVDPAPVALELRLRHWLLEAYNHQPHEAHRTPAGRLETPMQRWSADERALWTVSRDEIRSAFVTYAQRTVSRDRLVSVRGTFYELPLSLAPGGRQGPRVWIHEKVLDATLHVVCPHEGLVRIHPVDVPANARTRRRRRGSRGRGSAGVLPPSAADMAYERDLGSVLDADGGMSASGGPSSP